MCHAFTIHSKNSDELLLCARPSARCCLVVTSFSKSWTFWKIHMGDKWGIHLSISFLAGCAGLESRLEPQPIGLPTTSFPTCRLQGHYSQVAICRYSLAISQGTHCLIPIKPDRGDTGFGYFCIQLGISYISWSPTSKPLESHELQIAISCFRHVIIYQPRKCLNDSFHQKLSLSLSFGHNPIESGWRSLERY